MDGRTAYSVLGGLFAAAIVGGLSGSAGEGESARSGLPETDGAPRETILDHALEDWTGDFDGMVERGFVRLLTVYNPIFFTYDGAEPKGVVGELARALEKHLARVGGQKNGALHVVVIPVARDQLLPYLVEGKGDIAAANLTITPARQKLVDFSTPTYRGVSELVVAGPAAPRLSSLDDLTATQVHVRKSSSYFEHLSALNLARRRAGKPEIPVVAADELLEDYNLLELVNAGLIPAIIVDSHKAALWAQVFDKIRVDPKLAVNTGGDIAWAVRKGSPELLEVVNSFVKTARKGTLLGNLVLKRYLEDTDWIDNVRSGAAGERYQATVKVIKHYARAYGFDWLMIVAQAYQESKLDQSKRSEAGAVGVMQLLPSTAADPNVAVTGIDELDANVHAGVKYLRFLRDRYFSAPDIAPLDQVLFSLAAYNAGPHAIQKARRRSARMGLDPDTWFGQVELAAAKAIGSEPVAYVRGVYKYYVAYKRIAALRAARNGRHARQD